MSRHLNEAGFVPGRFTCIVTGLFVASMLTSGIAAAREKTTEEQELEQEIDRLQKELEEITKTIKELREKSSKTRSSLSALEKELGKAKAKGKEDPSAKKHVETLTEKIETMKAQQKKIDAETEAIRKLEQEKREAQRKARKKAGVIRGKRAADEKVREKEVARAKKKKPGAVDVPAAKPVSDAELRRAAKLKTAGITLPTDLPLRYMWSLPFDDRIAPGSIWAHKDVVLVLLTGNVLYCVRKNDGVPLWAIELSARPLFAPSVSPKAVYVFVGNRLTAIDRSAGQITWRIDPKFAAAAAPCVSEPNLYMPAWDRRIYAVEVKSKERVYLVGSEQSESLKAHEHIFRYSWHKTTQGHVVTTPTLAEGFLYFGSEDGYVYSVSVDGEDRYKSQTQGHVRSLITARGASIYAGSSDFNAYSFNRLTGQVRWSFPTGSDVLEPIYADPSSGVAMVVSSRNGIYGVCDRPGAERGTQQWYIPDGQFIAGVSDTLAYLGMTDNRLAAVDKKTGDVAWMSMLEGISEAVPGQNDWTKPDDQMRLLCIGESGQHLICLKERDEGMKRAVQERAGAAQQGSGAAQEGAEKGAK